MKTKKFISISLSKINLWKWKCCVCKKLSGAFSFLGECVLQMNGHIIDEDHRIKQSEWRTEFLDD